MSTEENKLLGRRFFEEVLNNGNLAVGDELGAANEDESLERKISGLALALATEPSKWGNCVRCWCISRNKEVSLRNSLPGPLGTLTNE
jgi:hypothetical protein